jgi:phosphoadenosine phosphosulfate reductase
MVKKRLANGDPCEKCAQTEEMLRRRGLWEQIDEVVWMLEGQDESPGAELARQHGVAIAPFFIVRSDGGEDTVFKSGLKLVRDLFPAAGRGTAKRDHLVPPALAELPGLAKSLANAEPADILRFGLERWGERCAIAFSGAEDVVLVDMATRLGLPFRVFTLDTGRLHGETYEFLDEVRRRYGTLIETYFPDAAQVAELMRTKGPNSFYRDGHQECCQIRKVEPMRRAMASCDAWVSGQRRDQSPATRSELSVILHDRTFEGAGEQLVKLNPLAHWTGEQVWDYIRTHDVPYNPLHDRGFWSIGCEPCTRPTEPDQHEREGRWWWENADEKECGLNVSGDGI